MKDAPHQSRDAPVGRIQPARAWFSNTKTVSQNELDECRNTVQTRSPYDVLISLGNVPYSLINNNVKLKRKSDFSDCFGSKQHSKRPKLPYKNIEEIRRAADTRRTSEEKKASEPPVKGQSRRIWNELYKVLDSSDVIVHVLDARDPEGTRCRQIDEYVQNQAPHKHLLYVLNKVDLVPPTVTAEWLRTLSQSRPCLAYQSNSLENNYGRENLLNVFRQLKTLYKKETVSIGFVGYPNSGKSSIINTLKNKKSCKSAPVPGETRVWQIVALSKGLYLIDSPGVVPVSDYDEAVLRGAIRVENVEDPEEFVPRIVSLVGKQAVCDCYGVEFDGPENLIERLAARYGKIRKGGEANVDLVARMILRDFHRGKIPYHSKPEAV